MTVHEISLEINALFQQALELEKEKKLDLAQKNYEKLLSYAPQHMGAQLNLANLLIQKGLLLDAIPFYKYIQNNHPNNPKFLTTLANLYWETSQQESAVETYKSAINHAADKIPLLHKIASFYSNKNDTHNAIAYLYWAHSEDKKNTQTLLFLGKCLHAIGKKEEAFAYFENAFECNNQDAHIGQIYANCLVDQGFFQKALTVYKQVLPHSDSKDQILDNMGKCLNELRQYKDAEALLRESIQQNPKNYRPHYHLGNTFSGLGQYKHAIRCFEHALDLNPKLAFAQYNLSLCYLSLGDYKKGLELYSWRWCVPHYQRELMAFPYPIWDGSMNDNLKLLIWDEQGIGDTIFFSQALAALSKTRVNLTLFCEQRLIPIITRSFPNISVYPKPSKAKAAEFPPNKYDAQIPIGDLIYFVTQGSLVNQETRSSQESNSSPFKRGASAYLKSDTKITKEMMKRYPKQPKIGISWRTSSSHNATSRSIGLTSLTKLIQAFPEVCWVNLQYGYDGEEWTRYMRSLKATHIYDPAIDPLINMDTFASQISLMDAVISIDNSTAHLAGALGKPTWLLIPEVHDWRWPLSGETCPWYSGMQLLRKGAEGWDDTFENLIKAISDFSLVQQGLPHLTQCD